MSQHARDTFGNGASRERSQGQDAGQSTDRGNEQDAAPKERTFDRLSGEVRASHSEARDEELNELRTLASAIGRDQMTHDVADEQTNDDMRAAVRQAARAARVRELREGAERAEPLNSDDAVQTLEGQGFSEDEALRLIAVTGRLEDSSEAREAAATLRRLRFTRWLVEQGRLDEWSA